MKTHSLNRRAFLARCGASALAAALPLSAAEGAGTIDTHTHFYDPTRPQGVPWPGKGETRLYRAVLPPEFVSLTKSHNIAGTVVVEASEWIEDNQWVLDLAAREKVINGLVGHLTPGDPAFRDQVKRFSRNPLFRGIRISGDSLKKGLGDRAFDDDLKVLADLDLSLDLNGGVDALSSIALLSAQLPTLRIIVNHVANQRIDGKTPPADWQSGMRGLHARRNVFAKVSGLVEGSGKSDGTAPTDTAFYKPVLDVIWEQFGPERLVFGSNWPVSALFAPYEVVHRIAMEYFKSRGGDAVQKVFRANSAAGYKWVGR